MSDKFEISRVFDASPERVWDAFTKPEQAAQWFSPKGTKTEVIHFDLKPGGHFHSKQIGTDGSVSWGKNIYREIDPPKRLVWEQGFANEAGEFIPAPFPMPWPLRMLTTIVFVGENSRTRLTLTWEPINPTIEESASFAQMLNSMTGGWTGVFDQLDVFLADT